MNTLDAFGGMVSAGVLDAFGEEVASAALDRRSRKGLLRTLDTFVEDVSPGEPEAFGEVSAEVSDAFDGGRFSVIGCFKNSNMMDTRALRARGSTPTDLIDHSMSGH